MAFIADNSFYHNGKMTIESILQSVTLQTVGEQMLFCTIFSLTELLPFNTSGCYKHMGYVYGVIDCLKIKPDLFLAHDK